MAEWTMSQPFGKYLAGAVAISFIAGGCVTIAKGVLRKYQRYQGEEARHSRAMAIACTYGLGARGILFVIVGCFFAYAAFTVNPDQAGSISDALNWIRGLPFGGLLYSLVAIGLASFGVYNLVQARYRIVLRPKLLDEVQTVKDTLRRAF